MLNGLDLFSGFGGISLALRDYVRPVVYCEIERYAQGILLSRMAEGRLPRAPIWDDVTSLDGESFRGSIDIIYGGFPCQDLSVAGLGKGLDGKRSGLFREIVRLAKEIQPAFLFLENVPAIRTRGLDRVIEELTEIGYDLRWTMLSAAEVGANHKRERWFLLANSTSRRLLQSPSRKMEQSGRTEIKRASEVVANSESRGRRKKLPIDGRGFEGSAKEGLASGFDICGENVSHSDQSRPQIREGKRADNGPQCSASIGASWWAVEPDVGRVVDGYPLRVERIKALGNGVVPAQVKQAFESLMGLK